MAVGSAVGAHLAKVVGLEVLGVPVEVLVGCRVAPSGLFVGPKVAATGLEVSQW